EKEYEDARRQGRRVAIEVMATRGMQAIAGARESLREAQALLRRSDYDGARKALVRAERVSKIALYSWEPSVTPEGRGVWFRVYAKSPEEARALVERVDRSGMNMLFPETIYWGMTLCPQLWDGAPQQHPQFAGWDPLEELIREAHGRGMQVHAWCEIFFMGPQGHSPLAKEHPDWVARDRRGGTMAKLESNFHFFCPARPEGREFILKNLVELARKYELDGLQLDYIRYPRSMPFENGFCYCDYCREKFQEEEGADPLELTPEKTPVLWEKWNRWREKQVSSFVAEASRRLHEARPGLVVSAAVFPEPEEERRREILQNWKEWSDGGWVDLLCPMIYRADTQEMRRLTEMDLRLAGDTPLLTGLAPFMKLSEEQLVEQIRAARELGARGQVLFSEEAMTQEMREVLREGPYRNAAAVPRF
ncbi:MAG: family 10 glycosylhydrolase, partial [bacterium]